MKFLIRLRNNALTLDEVGAWLPPVISTMDPVHQLADSSIFFVYGPRARVVVQFHTQPMKVDETRYKLNLLFPVRLLKRFDSYLSIDIPVAISHK